MLFEGIIGDHRLSLFIIYMQKNTGPNLRIDPDILQLVFIVSLLQIAQWHLHGKVGVLFQAVSTLHKQSQDA